MKLANQQNHHKLELWKSSRGEIHTKDTVAILGKCLQWVRCTRKFSPGQTRSIHYQNASTISTELRHDLMFNVAFYHYIQNFWCLKKGPRDSITPTSQGSTLRLHWAEKRLPNTNVETLVLIAWDHSWENLLMTPTVRSSLGNLCWLEHSVGQAQDSPRVLAGPWTRYIWIPTNQ